MDPNETRRQMRDAIGAEEWADALEHAEALVCWLRSGGFAPHGQSRAEALSEARSSARKAQAHLEATDAGTQDG